MLEDDDKRLITLSAFGLCSLLILSCGPGATRDQSANVTISIRGSTIQSGSNIVTFLITNGFEFPIRYAAAVETKEGTQTWKPIYISGRSITLLRGQILARDSTNFNWTLPPTNRWRIQVSYNDPRDSVFGKKVQGFVSTPEMIGGSPIAPIK